MTYRNVSMDFLRHGAILAVVAFHAALCFMEGAPAWWYVHGPWGGKGFAIGVALLDRLQMPLLFLIAGWALFQALQKKSVTQIAQGRLKKLLLPWLAGVGLVAPWLSAKILFQMGKPWEPVHFFTNQFWYQVYSQGPYWFLGILATLTLLFLGLLKTPLGPLMERFLQKSWSLWLLGLATSVSFAWGSLGWGKDAWTDVIWIWNFQPARLGAYAMFFLAGYGLAARQGPFLTWKRWVPAALIFALANLVLAPQQVVTWSQGLLEGLAFTGWSLCASFALLGFFQRFCASETCFLSHWTGLSFGVYWIHLPILILIVPWIFKAPLPPWGLWTVLVVVTILLSTLLVRAWHGVQRLLGKI